jgi:hypothetical protein
MYVLFRLASAVRRRRLGLIEWRRIKGRVSGVGRGSRVMMYVVGQASSCLVLSRLADYTRDMVGGGRVGEVDDVAVAGGVRCSGGGCVGGLAERRWWW